MTRLRMLAVALLAILSLGAVCLLDRERAMGAVELEAVEQAGCSPYTEHRPIRATPIEWTFRLCDAGPDRYRIELGFVNRSLRTIHFRYRLWLTRPGPCVGWRQPQPNSTARHMLPPGEPAAGTDSFVVARAAYGGGVWICVSDLDGVSGGDRVLFLVPCIGRMLADRGFARRRVA